MCSHLYVVWLCILLFIIGTEKTTNALHVIKDFAWKKTGEEVAKRENVSVLVETNTRNKNGDVIGSQEQYVPGERITYRVNKICKKCGKGCYSTYRRDIPKV